MSARIVHASDGSVTMFADKWIMRLDAKSGETRFESADGVLTIDSDGVRFVPSSSRVT